MQIKLENAVWVLEKLLKKKLHGDDTVKLLMNVNVDFYTIGKGKGGRVMVTQDVASQLPNFDWTIESGRKRRKKAVPKDGPPVAPEVVERIVERIDPAWKADIETIVTENDARVDDLFKAVKDMRAVYIDLRKRVDTKANMPEPPPLPPRFRRRILVAGLDSATMSRMRDNFRDVEIVHIGDWDTHSQKAFGRSFDLVLVMTSYVAHSVRNAVEKKIPKEDIQYIKGGQSSLEGAISVWLNEQRKKDEE